MRRTRVALVATMVGICACSRDRAPTAGASAAAAPAVTVRISYGSEKKAFLTDSIGVFHQTNPRTTAGHPIRIEAVAEGSAEAMESILAGRDDIAVWSPASTLLVDVLNDRYAEGKGLGSDRRLADEAPPIVLSPVVIAMWEPMARALGWPKTPVGWADVAKLTTSTEGWARFGHPEWGSFKFGHTHPRYSNSGAIALVASTYAGAGKTRDLEVGDVAHAAPFVRRVQSGVVHYGRSTGFFAEKMFTRGPAYLSAAVLYENLVVESYLESRYQAKPFPVVAVYPREGTFWSDHPFAILNLPSVTPEVREAAGVFRTFLLSAERQKAALQRFGFRPADPAIALGPPLDDAHGIDPAMPENVLPNPRVAVTRRILETFEDVKRPVSVTLVLDTSGSMNGAPLQGAKEGARIFLDGLPTNDQVRLLLFNDVPRWQSDEARPVGAARKPLAGAVDSSFAQGGTALYDAIRLALKPPSGETSGLARAVVVLSDGQDTDSKTPLAELVASLRQANTSGEGPGGTSPPRLFTIAYGEKADTRVLQQLAEAGGGAFFSGTPKDIKAVYADLATFF